MRRRILLWGSGVAVVFLLAMVVIHLPMVRPWLAKRGHTGAGLCPLGYGTSTSLADRSRTNALQRGAAAAKARPALGFTLDVTTAADLTRWAATHKIKCVAKHGAHLVECENVPASLTGSTDLALTSVWFELGPRGRLSAIRTVRRDIDPASVTSAFSTIERDLSTHVGEASNRSGSAQPELLARATLRQAAVEYRFTDYRAALRATNMGDGYVLTEEYASLVD